MCEGISTRDGDCRLGRKILRDIGHAHVQNTWHQPFRAENASTQKRRHAGAAQRLHSGRSGRAVGGSEVSFRQIAETLAYVQLSALPSELLIEVHLLQCLESFAAQAVVSGAAFVVESQVVVAPS